MSYKEVNEWAVSMEMTKNQVYTEVIEKFNGFP